MSNNPASASNAQSSLPPRRNPAGGPYPVRTVRHADRMTITYKDDGYDYIGLYERLRRGDIPVKILLHDDAKHYVYLVSHEGRDYIFKRFGELDGRFDTKLWRFFAGPFYSTLLRQVNRAVAKGCDVVGDIYLVAEQMRYRLSYDNYILQEFVPGKSLEKCDLTPYVESIAQAFTRLHRFGLSLGNVKDGNLVLAPDNSIKIIDLSTRGTQFTGRAKDAIKVKRLWNIDLPSHSLTDRLARSMVGTQLFISATRRKIKRALGLDKRKRKDWMNKTKQ